MNTISVYAAVGLNRRNGDSHISIDSCCVGCRVECKTIFFISPFGLKLLTSEGGGEQMIRLFIIDSLFLSEKEESRGSRIATRRFFIEIHRTTNAHESAAILDFFFFFFF
jgi:hypothetical protein